MALRRASPVCTAEVSSLFCLQRLCSKRHQLSFLQRCVASVAQRFFMGRARLQGWAPPFGLRVSLCAQAAWLSASRLPWPLACLLFLPISAHEYPSAIYPRKRLSAGCLAFARSSPAFAWSVSGLLGLWRLCSKRHQLSFSQRCAASVAQRFFMGRARLQGWAHAFGLRV